MNSYAFVLFSFSTCGLIAHTVAEMIKKSDQCFFFFYHHSPGVRGGFTACSGEPNDWVLSQLHNQWAKKRNRYIWPVKLTLPLHVSNRPSQVLLCHQAGLVKKATQDLSQKTDIWGKDVKEFKENLLGFACLYSKAIGNIGDFNLFTELELISIISISKPPTPSQILTIGTYLL